MSKMINFSINEISGRTFELPYETAIKLIKENYPNEYNRDLDKLKRFEIADILFRYCYNEIEKYEIDNDYFDSNIDEINFYDTKVQASSNLLPFRQY